MSSSTSSSSSCRTASMDLPDPLLPPVSIFYCSREVFQATSRIGTELYIGSSWSSYLCSSMWKGPHYYIVYEFVVFSPAVTRMSGSSNSNSFMMGGRWPYSCCFVGCCLQDLPFFPYVSVHVVHPYSSIDWAAASKRCVNIFIFNTFPFLNLGLIWKSSQNWF